MTAMTDTKIGGLLLIISSVMVIVLALISPGGPLIDPVSQFDLVDAAEVLANNAALTHAGSLLFAVAMLLFLYGLITIWNAVPAQGGMATASRIGVLMVGFAALCIIVTMGLNHAIVHVATHGIGVEQSEEQIQSLLLALQTVKFGLRYIAGTAAVLGFIPLSLGMSTRLPAGFYRVASQVVFVCSLLAFIQLLIAEHFHDFDIDLLYQIGALLAMIVFVWVIILGVALYKELVELPRGNSTEMTA